MNSRRRWFPVVVGLMGAAPVGGFLFGLLNAGDPDPNPVGRLMYACLMAVVTPLHAGFPPNPGAGAGQTFNLWPHMAASFVLIWGVLTVRERKRFRQQTGATGTPSANRDKKSEE
ncbi:MAG: hypothetical protein U1G08_04225 [Verrucomicrobiota bacterium]